MPGVHPCPHTGFGTEQGRWPGTLHPRPRSLPFPRWCRPLHRRWCRPRPLRKTALWPQCRHHHCHHHCQAESQAEATARIKEWCTRREDWAYQTWLAESRSTWTFIRVVFTRSGVRLIWHLWWVVSCSSCCQCPLCLHRAISRRYCSLAALVPTQGHWHGNEQPVVWGSAAAACCVGRRTGCTVAPVDAAPMLQHACR